MSFDFPQDSLQSNYSSSKPSDESVAISHHEEIDAELSKLFNKFKTDSLPIEVDFRKLVNWIPYSDSYTHYFHSYPAKLLKHIPIFFLNSKILLPEKGSIVLDPFCGSGTVLLESMLSGHNGLGCDANPLARLIAKVKTTKLDVSKIQNQKNSIIATAKRLRKFTPLNVTNIDHWFPKKTQLDLSKLIRAIERLPESNEKDFFKATFSSIIKKVSFSDPNLSVPVKIKPSKYKDLATKEKAEKQLTLVENTNVLSVFEKHVEQNIKRISLLETVDTESLQCKVISKDARHISNSLSPNSDQLNTNSVDFIVTSPPYAGAQKYVRSSSLNLGWLGFCEQNTLRDYERLNIGREHYSKSEYKDLIQLSIKEIDIVLEGIWKKNPLRAHINGNYLLEMKSAIIEMYRVLKHGKYCTIVIGNNEVCGEPFETQKFIRLLAEEIGFTTKLVLVDEIHSRGLMTKRNKTASVINSEWILVFKK
jgi:DNA modification methylase